MRQQSGNVREVDKIVRQQFGNVREVDKTARHHVRKRARSRQNRATPCPETCGKPAKSCDTDHKWCVESINSYGKPHPTNETTSLKSPDLNKSRFSASAENPPFIKYKKKLPANSRELP
ncbi:hypothetical protein [Lentibacillus persicus]|uniref:hypothetical protein n=1 Tax=Lentibacillus persicus TaxID=640948 RepID=UPI001C42F50D|nr:hypothetical protein [Lentibacillus persicus]